MTEEGMFTFRCFINKACLAEFQSQREELQAERLKALDCNNQIGYKNCVLNELKII